MKFKRKYVDGIQMVLFVLIVGFIIVINFSSYKPYSLVVIDNSDPNSMYPTYQQGDIFIIKNTAASDIVLGDVIVYVSSSGINVIHRVVDIQQIGGSYYFRVTGDDPITNDYIDSPNGKTLIPYDRVLGTVAMRIPLLGHISLALNQSIVAKAIVVLTIIGMSIYAFQDDDEEEEEYYEVNIPEIKNQVRLNLGKLNGKNILAIVFLVILSVSPLFIGAILGTPGDTIITNVELGYGKTYNESQDGKEYNFYYQNVKIMVNDSGGRKSLEYFEMRLISNGKEISFTVWNVLRQMSGTYMIGGTFLIQENNIPADGASVTIQITYFTRSDSIGRIYTKNVDFVKAN